MTQQPEQPIALTPATPVAPWPNLFYLFIAGAVYGLMMRAVFGLAMFQGTHVSDAGGAMLGSFLLLVPALIGMLTVYRLAPARRTWGKALLLPWVPTLLFVAGTALLLIEGSICIVMALPIFLILASFGGFLMWLVMKFSKPSTAVMSSFLLLPVVSGLYERTLPLPDALQTSDASIHIAAPAAAIWQLINRAEHIAPAEMADGWAYRIGVPHPLEAITVAEDGVRVRKLRWEQGVHFDEPILDWDENHYIRWRYVFAADSIPPGALDEHVTIGGRYFDLIDTSYRLEPETDGTRLTIHVSYRVSTRFNWYAARLARWLVDDSARTILAFYQHRGEMTGVAKG
jgi:hypothetical protein